MDNRKLTPLMENLLSQYMSYVDKMNEWKSYRITMYNNKGEFIKTANMIAYDKNHLLIEVSLLYTLENVNLETLEIEEIY